MFLISLGSHVLTSWLFYYEWISSQLGMFEMQTTPIWYWIPHHGLLYFKIRSIMNWSRPRKTSWKEASSPRPSLMKKWQRLLIFVAISQKQFGLLIQFVCLILDLATRQLSQRWKTRDFLATLLSRRRVLVDQQVQMLRLIMPAYRERMWGIKHCEMLKARSIILK